MLKFGNSMLLFLKPTLLDADKTTSNIARNNIFLFIESYFICFLVMCLFNFSIKVL